jgi:hypothetical protein
MITPNIWWGVDTQPHPANRRPDIEKALQEIFPLGVFTYVDLACGDGDVIKYLAKQFPESSFVGVDMNCPGREDLLYTPPKNLTFVEELWQEHIDTHPSYDVCSLLNTYRNWPDQYEEERIFFHSWLDGYVKYFICSVGGEEEWKKLPWSYRVIGEDFMCPLLLCKIGEKE